MRSSCAFLLGVVGCGLSAVGTAPDDAPSPIAVSATSNDGSSSR